MDRQKQVTASSPAQRQQQQQQTALLLKPLDSLEDVDRLLSKDPLLLFQDWFERAQYTDGVRLATSASLATASKSGRPSCRTVGVKGFDRDGFKIATNSNSVKAKEMDENPFASLLFYWEPLNRMVRIDGPVKKLPIETTVSIWRGLSHAAQLLHSASRQDEIIATAQEVKDRRKLLSATYPESTPVPPNLAWCSYNLEPDRWEFYQACTDFPERIVFRRPAFTGERHDGVSLHQGQEGWLIEMLSP